MTHYSRRDFLTHSARIGGALALTQMGGSSPFAAETPPAMAIAKWAGDPIADADSTTLASMAVKLTEQALDAVGGRRGDHHHVGARREIAGALLVCDHRVLIEVERLRTAVE